MARKKGGFASEMAELMDSRAPKELDVDGEQGGVPGMDAEDEWGAGLYDDAAAAGDAAVSRKKSLAAARGTKRLRMRGDLSGAFTEGAYKGRVVSSDAAFGGEMPEDEDEDEEEEEEEEEEGAEMSLGTDDEAMELLKGAGFGGMEGLEDMEEGEEGEEGFESDDGSLEAASDEEEEEEEEVVPAPKKAAKKKADAAASGVNEYGKPLVSAQPDYPQDDLSESVASDDDGIADKKTGKLSEAAISSKMDSIFGILDGMDDEDGSVEGKGETYEDFMRTMNQREKTEKSTKKRKWKRNPDDYPSDEENQVDQDKEEDDEFARQIASVREATEESSKFLIKAAHTDIGKSEAARNQYKVWSKLVACRIHLQQPLAWAARLPQHYSRDAFEDDDQTRTAGAAVSSKLCDIISSLHDLREGMLKQNPSFRSRGAAAVPPRPAFSKKQKNKRQKLNEEPTREEEEDRRSRELDWCWRVCAASQSAVHDKVDDALDHWHSRAMLHSAQATEQKMTSTAQASTQIKQTLEREAEKRVARTQATRGGQLAFGHPESERARKDPRFLLVCTRTTHPPPPPFLSCREAHCHTTHKPLSHTHTQTPDYARNEDIFDDSDFYRWLLSDYIHKYVSCYVVLLRVPFGVCPLSYFVHPSLWRSFTLYCL